MTEPSQPVFLPAAFAVMSVLVTHTDATFTELEGHLTEKPAILLEAIQMLVGGGYAAQTERPETSAPAYRATPKGQTAFFEQVSWLKRRMNEHE